MKNAFDSVTISLTVFLFCIALAGSPWDTASAEETTGIAQKSQKNPPAESEYHTPLAGEPSKPEVFGRTIDILGRNRDNAAALVMGATIFTPPLAEAQFLPFGAFYWKHRWDDTRFRGIFSIMVNEADISETFGKWQLLGHLDNNTVPFAQPEIAGGQTILRTSIIFGTVNGRLGAGLRLPVAPFQADNDLRVQLFYQGGYLYSDRVEDTGPNVFLPPDTLVHGPLLRVRYDGLRRNLMELPHRGVAAGMDVEFARRDSWSDANYGGATFTRDETRDYLKLSGYLIAATGIPGLSERNRLIFSFYGGSAPYDTLDRFSSFRIGGGPLPSETDDLFRQVYPGAMFNQFPASEYLIGSAEYRRELLFFLYFHLRSTFAWVNREIFTTRRLKTLENSGEAFTAAITSGFLWESVLSLEYSYDSSVLRNGKAGSNITIIWAKGF
ncbi:MAG: hypothetical protein FD174_3081 [Geobacteraceae bacterium]|nr:MAG: hypothetical protein FD174_3081 [Geobacteraceae bacterium]